MSDCSDSAHYAEGDITVKRLDDLCAVMLKLFLFTVAATLFASSVSNGRSLDIENLKQLIEFKDVMEAMMKKGAVKIMK